jgi:Protein of unknown function (DUF2726)
MAAVLLILVVVTALLLPRKRWLSRIRRKPLLTPNETEFFHRLQRALPAYHVFPQVPFAALLTVDSKLSRKARWSIRNRFDRKIADFVVCERDGLQVVAIIELDDRTHDAKADRERDAITNAAGYQTYRFQSKKKPSEADIAALFNQAQAGGLKPANADP